MRVQQAVWIGVLAVASAAVAMADGGMGAGGMMGGSGMLVVADDGSVLVTEMGMGGGHMGGGDALDRELVNVGPDGQERWRASFDDGWPTRPVTDGDLVVVALTDDWWMGHGGPGDGGWDHHGGPGIAGRHDDDPGAGATLVALSLSTGQELWTLEVDGDMASMPQFTDDGARLYLTVRDHDGDHVGDGPMRQGDSPGPGMLMSSTLLAVDRDGTLLWSLDLGDGHHMGGPMAGGGS